MSTDQLLDLEREHDNAQTNSRIGMGIAGAGILLFLAKVIWGTDISSTMAGIIVGGGVVFWAMCHDKATKTMRRMDEVCYLKYGKSHEQSYTDIREDRYNKNINDGEMK
ncbi:hypothetical protein ACQ86O_21195 [Serratia sp. L9]|uniref:hypothetical protein n=1 Tax=Serratia sp. L9 TaxID=3423946 RepID=UPI003D67337A